MNAFSRKDRASESPIAQFCGGRLAIGLALKLSVRVMVWASARMKPGLSSMDGFEEAPDA